MERLLAHFEIVLHHALIKPDTSITKLPVLTTAERRRVLNTWSRSDGEDSPAITVHALFEAQAARGPDAEAVVFGDASLTYADLNQQADQLAQRLRDAGVGPGTRVGLCLERSVDLATGMLGVLKAGGAYIPLDPAYPEERLRLLLDDAQVHVLLTDSNLHAPLSESGDHDTGEATPKDLAYVMYTSGTTGRPKGVCVSHANLVHSTTARFAYYPENPERYLLLSSFAFDSSVAGIYWTLCSGGTLVLAPRRIEQDVQALARLFEEQRITHTLMLPSLYALLLDYADPEQLRTLRTVIVAGEACPPHVVRRHFEVLPDVALYNEYGPTEATVWCSVHRFEPADVEGPVPIGGPIPNATLYVLDAYEQPVPVGIPGELYVGGAGLARGYWNRPDLTDERFVQDPFSPIPEDRLYRTGDRVYWRRDGRLGFQGRIDQQVKIRGHRIEVEEIEHVLREHPGVRDVAVTAQGTPVRLIAYVVVSADELEEPVLRRYAATRLPDYMVPARVVFLDALPRTPNGKLDTRALPAPDLTPSTIDATYTAPRTPAERQLAEIWQSVLDRAEIGIHDNFFEIGGDSILSIHIVARARPAGFTLKPNDLFEHQTIAELAAVISEIHRSEDEQSAPAEWSLDETASPVHEARYPLTPTQQALLFHVLLYDDSDLGFLQVRTDFEGPFARPAFERAWMKVIERHSVLRTSFSPQSEMADEPLQIVHRTVHLPLVVHDWRTVSPEEQNERLATLLREDRAQGFDLSVAPVMRLFIIHVDDERTQVVWSGHHLLLDGWSWSLVFEEVFRFYEAFRAGHVLDLDQPRPYADYVHALRQQDLEAAKALWRGALADWEPVRIGHISSTPTSFETQTLRLNPEAGERLQTFIRHHHLTLGTLIQAAWALLLGQMTNRTDVLFGMVVSGRAFDLPGIESMVGLFSNALPVRVRLSDTETLLPWFRRLQQERAATQPYEFCLPDQIRSWTTLPGSERLFDTLVIIQNYRTNTFAGEAEGRLRLHSVGAREVSTYPLTLFIEPGTPLTLHAVHDVARFSPEETRNLLDQLRALLLRLIEDPEREVADLRSGISLPDTLTSSAVSPPPSPIEAGLIEPPRYPTESKLTTLWQRVLGLREVGIYDDFFALGGRSLSAVRLFSLIEKHFGRTLPLSTLIERPTIAQLAQLLHEGTPNPEHTDWRSLVPLQPLGSHPPLFLIHAGTGEVMFYHTLAQHLGTDQPVYALQALGLDGQEPPHERIEDMAAHYLREMRTIQPYGPYRLAGRCLGNAVALEIAHQIYAQGEEVALLIALDSALTFREDTPPPVPEPSVVRTSSRLMDYIRNRNWERVRARTRAHTRRITWKLKLKWTNTIGSEQAQNRRRVTDVLNEALYQYVPQPFPGKVALIRSEELAIRADKAFHLEIWSYLAEGGFESSVIPTRHITMFDEPDVTAVAAEARRYLEATLPRETW